LRNWAWWVLLSGSWSRVAKEALSWMAGSPPGRVEAATAPKGSEVKVAATAERRVFGLRRRWSLLWFPKRNFKVAVEELSNPFFP
jgi:hypothetical protein